MNSIVFFSGSIFAASVLLMLKSVEASSARKNLFLSILGKIDKRLGKLVTFINFKIYQAVQTTRYILMVQTRQYMKSFSLRLQEAVRNEYRMREGQIMGRRHVAGKGSASFYLKKITEGREFAERGRIEEDLVD